MTIKGLQTDKQSLPRAGIIRLGYKEDTGRKDKHENVLYRPVEAPYFVLTDAPGVAEALGTDKPTELKIYFPFDDIDMVFPAFMQNFTASALVCRGDGEQIIYAIDAQTGKATVRDGAALVDFTEGKRQFKAGDKMACPGTDRNLYPKCERCKANALLLILLREVPRLAYYQIATGSIHNIIELTGQLNTVRETITKIIGVPKLTGVPFILKRVPRKISVPKGDNGRQRITKYFLQLEIDPDWVLKMLLAQRRLADPLERLALPATVGQQATVPDIEIIEPVQTVQRVEPPVWEPPAEDGEFEPEAETGTPEQPAKPAPAPQPAPAKPANGNGYAPTSPQKLLEVVNKRVEATYDNVPHLFNALRNEIGAMWTWPIEKDVEGWQKAYEAALAHAQAKSKQAQTEPAPATDEEAPF